MLCERTKPSAQSARICGFLGVLIVAYAPLQGCAPESEAGENAIALEDREESTADEPLQIASVKANGTGCPAGSWRATPSRDGKLFSLTFSGFDAEVNRRRSTDVEDCQLTISVKNPGGKQQFALEELEVAGGVSLADGANAKIVINEYFQGDPTKGFTIEGDYNGPLRKELSLSTGGTQKELLWSECGKERDLNVRTTVRVKGQSSSRRRSPTSSVHIREISGAKLAVRSCPGTEPTPDAGPEPTPDAGPEPTPDAGPEPTPDAGPEPTPDAGPEPTPDAGPEPTPDAGPDPVPTPTTGISAVIANGTGCALGTTAITIAPDGQSAKLTYPAFSGKVGDGTSIAAKACQLGITVRDTSKYRYTVTSTTVGRAKLSEGVRANISSLSYLSGAPTTPGAPTTLNGPYDAPLTVEHESLSTNCGPARDVQLRTQVSMNGTTAGEVTFESQELVVKSEPCP
jgi:hypothetical protein